jgi:lipopolysaccharide/colanic/teichoic acid biosynthesis glycosyltransferase
MYINIIKRFFDFIFSLLAFLLLSPVFIITSILLAIKLKGIPFFIQKRPGYKGRIFNIVKFKTMSDLKDEQGNLLPDEERVFKLGLIIRKLSIDEIPQLLNVIKGDMSLVGPRPLLVRYLDLYSDFQKQRHQMKPGITGWAQVNGRNALSWAKKFEFDVWYVNNVSFFLDLKILFLTILKVFKREGISGDNTVTMTEFKGEIE